MDNEIWGLRFPQVPLILFTLIPFSSLFVAFSIPKNGSMNGTGVPPCWAAFFRKPPPLQELLPTH